MRIPLIENWRSAWRMASMHIATAAILFGTLPADSQASLLDLIGLPPSRLPAILGILFIIGRLVKQPAVSGPP